MNPIKLSSSTLGHSAVQIQHRNWFLFACVLSVVFLFSAYSNHFHNAFHFDDIHSIEENLYIRSIENIPTFFVDAKTTSRFPPNAIYRPLLTTTFAMDYWLSGHLDPWQFHVTQFVLLLLLGIGLWFFFLRLINLASLYWWNRYAALFGAVLFCLHTANTGTVNYILSRSDLLSTLFVVLAFLIYFYFPGGRRFHLCIIPMALGALVKTPAVIFAPLLFVYILLFEQTLSLYDLFSLKSWPKVRMAIWRALPALIVGIFMFLFTEAMNPSLQSYGGGSRLDYLLTQSFVWLHYVRLFFVPLGLTTDPDWGLLPHWYDTRFFAGLLLIAILVSIVSGNARRHNL